MYTLIIYYIDQKTDKFYKANFDYNSNTEAAQNFKYAIKKSEVIEVVLFHGTKKLTSWHRKNFY